MDIALPTPPAWMTCQVEPGTLFLLAQAEYGSESAYRAVLACPGCGTLGLITQAQYAGHTAMMCGAERCCAEYTLVNNRIHFRPAQ